MSGMAPLNDAAEQPRERDEGMVLRQALPLPPFCFFRRFYDAGLYGVHGLLSSVGRLVGEVFARSGLTRARRTLSWYPKGMGYRFGEGEFCKKDTLACSSDTKEHP